MTAGSTGAAHLTGLATALADRYRIERALGAGGMATVHLARDLRHDRDVAVKVLHPDLGAALGGERFLAEIRTTARLQHPHILPLLDSGDAGGGLLYYVMPYVRGETLRARLERERQLPVDDALRIARQVADALRHAHGQGIVHRDVKPENILLQDGHALVADFGIALAVQQAGGQRLTQTGLSLGTPQYMSPEQAMGERTVDARADVYALGAVTYEMLAGEPPFTGPTVQAIVARVLTERPRPIRTLRDTVPPSVDDAVARALAKLPADRFASVEELAAQLVPDGRQPDARARVAPPRLARPALLAVLAALALGAAAGVGGTLLVRRAPGDALPSPYATGSLQLTFDGRAGLPAISAGGEAIAFVRSRCEQPGASGFVVYSDHEGHASPCRYALVVMDSAGTREVTVVDGMLDVAGVRFTADGTRLVVAAVLEPGRAGTYVIPRLGGALRRVGPFGAIDLQRGTDTLLVLPPDSLRGAAAIAHVVDLASGRATDSIALPSPAVFAATWSPDHQRLVAASPGMLYVLGRRGAVSDSVAGAWKAHLRWTPRGDAVMGFVPAPGQDDAFVGVRIGGDGRVRGPAVAMMPRVPTLYRGEFDVATGTGALAYVGGTITNETWMFRLDGGAPPRVVGNSTTFYDIPALAPDGHVVYTMRGDALGDNVYRLAADSARPVEEPLTATRASSIFGSVRISGDGRRLYYAQRDTGAFRLRSIDLRSGEQADAAFPSPPDLRHLPVPVGASGFAQLVGDGHVVRVQARAGEPARDLRTPDSITVLSITADAEGTALGAVVATGGRLLVGTFPLAAFAFHPRAALDGVGTASRPSWQANGDLFVARWVPGHDRPTLFRVPPTGGRAIATGEVPARCLIESIGVALAAPVGACFTTESRGDVRLLRIPGGAP